MMLQPIATGGSTASKLAVEGVSKWFRNSHMAVHALDNVSLDIGGGEFICLVGPSGCGKSTLLDIMAGLTKADSGTVRTDGEPIGGPGRQRLVMFQEPALFPWLTAFGNVMFGLKLRARSQPRAAQADRSRLPEACRAGGFRARQRA